MEKQIKQRKKVQRRLRRYVNKSNKIMLREYRESIGLNQTELGQLVGVNSRSISAYELGTRRPSTKVAVKLARVFNVKLEVLFPFFAQ